MTPAHRSFPAFLRALRALGPAIPSGTGKEALRAGLGAFIGLGVGAVLVLSPSVDLAQGLFMIAPFGASAVLIFAVPNSPLAQPWSAVVGNTLSAVVGVAVSLHVANPELRLALAVGLAIFAMVLARAVHPPAGAVALTTALSPHAVHALGFRFALTPVALGSVILVVVGMIYARSTGRRYPFRQFAEENARGTADPPPAERLGLTEAELADILSRYRQSMNVGIEDLARLIGAAEMQAATHHTRPFVAADIMSRDVVSVTLETPVAEVAALFRDHRFTSLPVVGAHGDYLGIIFQIHLLALIGRDALAGPALPLQARDLMSSTEPTAPVDAPMTTLVALLAEEGRDAIPILDGPAIAGIVTQTDMLAALARSLATEDVEAAG
ncbi:MAG: HPP family protein [Paracoccaceae bacterium]|nr:HPP family protein [Paracoccaceae bacterium]MDE3239269.1 HPP family protein [Paracoccaceae bacterium]